ncbi:hypothetical protein A2U01_0097036, partial [Trifolium medium]|nr:hypothetical protein [Trifolium medium]
MAISNEEDDAPIQTPRVYFLNTAIKEDQRIR